MSSSLTALLKKAHLSSPEEVLQAADAAIQKDKRDLTAHQARLVALLKLEDYGKALKHVETVGDKLRAFAPLETAYLLYKLDRFEEAKKVADQQSSDNRGFLHISAQAAYRLEQFDRASSIYKQLASSEGDEQYDLKIQRSALDAQLEWGGLGDRAENKKPQREDLDAFESAYNAACGCIARGELSQADVLLNRAKQLCSASPDLSEEVKAIELLPITIQWSYVKLALGRATEAAQLLEDLDLTSNTDLSLRRIAAVNSLVSSPESNPFYAHRLFHSTSSLDDQYRPFEFQKTILRQNSCTLDLQSSKFAGTTKSTSAAIAAAPQPTDSASVNTLSVIHAAASARGQEDSQAIKSVSALLEKRPTDVGILLLLVQLYVSKNNHCSAIASIESFFQHIDNTGDSSAQAVRFAPGLVAVAVTLYNSQGRTTSSRSLLASAAKYWRTSAADSETPPNTALLRAAGTSLLESGEKQDAEEALAIFKDLHSRNANDKAAAAGVVAATSVIDPAAVDSILLKALTPVSRLTAAIDAAALETAGVARPPEQATTASKKRSAASTAQPAAPGAPGAGTATKKKRKLPKSRIPPDYVPGKQLDPERWLPLRDRSSWRPKGRKGKAKAAGLTQGGVVAAADEEKGKSEQSKVVAGGQARKTNAAKKKSKGGKR